jgi:hypothetical protein
MRSAIFLGALMIGLAINTVPLSDAFFHSMSIITIVFFVMDVLELSYKGRKPNKEV